MKKNIRLTFLYVGHPLKEYHTFVTPSANASTLKTQITEQLNGVIPLNLSIIQEKEFVVRYQEKPLLHQMCSNLFIHRNYSHYEGWMKFDDESTLYNWTEKASKAGHILSFVQHESMLYLSKAQKEGTDSSADVQHVANLIEQMVSEKTTGYDKRIIDWLCEHQILKAYCLKQINFIIEHRREEYSKEFGSRKFVSEQDVKEITLDMLSEKKSYQSSHIYSMLSFQRIARFYGMDDTGTMVNVCLEKASNTE
jgi:hypothetical protein